MSENLLSIQSFAQELLAIWLWTALVLVAIAVIFAIVETVIGGKKKKLEKELRDCKEASRDNIYDLTTQKIGATEERKKEISQEIVAIEENEKTVSEELEPEIKKYEKRLKIMDNLEFVKYTVCGIFILILFVELLLAPFVGGSFSSLRKTDYQDMNLSVNAYYVITYREVDQVTLTVFVKNNSDKSLRSALIKQKGTNSTSTIRNLDAGEEKIVTIDTYYSENYEFEFENIEFVE